MNDERSWRESREVIESLLFHPPQQRPRFVNEDILVPPDPVKGHQSAPYGTEMSHPCQVLANWQYCEQLGTCGYYKPLSCGMFVI